MSQYRPVKRYRFFQRKKRYSAIDWNDEAKAIKAFRKQLVDWYIRPTQALIKTPHAEFAVMALTCVLIDTLSQYEAGRVESSASVFKNWLRAHFRRFGTTLNPPIATTIRGQPAQITNYAEAIYNGFRCGILHEAHVALYGGITGQKQAVSYHRRGLTLYANGDPCPTVVVHPRLLFQRVKKEFEAYFDHLLDADPKWQGLRNSFKNKFFASYGIDIGNEP